MKPKLEPKYIELFKKFYDKGLTDENIDIKDLPIMGDD